MAEIVTVAAALLNAGVKLTEVLTKLGIFSQDIVNVDHHEMKNDIESLKKEVCWMRDFLLEAQNKPGSKNSKIFQRWVSEISQLATQSEAIAAEINLFALEQQKVSQKGCLSLKCCFSDNNDSSRIHDLSVRIKDLLRESQNISDRRNRYDPNADAGSSSVTKFVDTKLNETRRTTPYTNNEYMVGHNESIKDLTTRLMDKESSQFVTSIVGMGGLGKTTLARKLYNSLSSQHFTSRAWVCVSQVYNTKDILMDLINLMTRPTKEDRDALTSIYLIETYLHKYLTDQRFLVVIDDVWEREARESLERAFPNNNNGSKVIITTRNEHVAAFNNAYVHRLRYLNKDESWDLFCTKVLSRDKEFPSELEKIGKEMVAKCSGLPLAIVVLGGILIGKPLYKWEIVKNNIWKELEKETISINAILTLSFEDLPEHLKQCFLYVAMFPEDFEIERSKLMLLWEAEGFIENGEEGDAGDATKLYFEELVGRSLFFKTGGDWIDSTFRVHDLLRDLAITKSREMGISVFYDGKRTVDISKAPSHRRITVFHPHNDIPVEYTNTSLHTFIFWEIRVSINNTTLHGLIRTLPEKFQNLRVLNVSCTSDFESIPDSIGDLIHLGFLSFDFNHSGIYKNLLPNTIGNLKALQTLSISGALVQIPKTVLKLTQLKHLIGIFKFSSDKIGSLVSLETLIGISGEQWCCVDTTNLVKLRRLKLWNIRKVKDIFYDNFRKLERLETLSLSLATYGLDISLEKIFELCPSISHLKTGKISFHNSLNLDRFAKNLVVLECDLDKTLLQDTISLFGRLPRLEALNLNIAWLISTDVHVDKGFAQLRFLKIRFSSFGFVVSEDCMPLLEHLEVHDPSKFEGPARMMRLLVLNR